MKTFTTQEVKAALLSNDLRSAQIMLDANEDYFQARISNARSNAVELNNRIDALLDPIYERQAEQARWEALSPEEQQAERDQKRAEHEAWKNRFHGRLNAALGHLYND